jgi:large subunit ribosomal protein L5
MTSMTDIRIEKLTLNIGAGKDQALLEKGVKLLKNITGIDPVKCITTKRIPSWGVRPGLPIGAKITLRDKNQITNLLTRFLKAKGNKLPKSCFDNYGNVSFGIHEYIDVPELEYDPQIGIIGFQICITLERPGFSIKRQSVNDKKVGKKHLIKQDDAISFMSKTFGVELAE